MDGRAPDAFCLRPAGGTRPSHDPFLESHPDAPVLRPCLCTQVSRLLAFVGAAVPSTGLQMPADTVPGQLGPGTRQQSPNRLMAREHQEPKGPGPLPQFSLLCHSVRTPAWWDGSGSSSTEQGLGPQSGPSRNSETEGRWRPPRWPEEKGQLGLFQHPRQDRTLALCPPVGWVRCRLDILCLGSCGLCRA